MKIHSIKTDKKQTYFKGKQDAHILVTGATGYIGSNLVQKLAKKGYNCTICANSPIGKEFLEGAIQKISSSSTSKGYYSFVPLNIANKTSIEQAVKNKKIDAVVHLAGVNNNGESIINPKKYYRTNTTGTGNLLDVMLDNDVKNMVFMSTGNVYGKIKAIPVNELHPQNPTTPYARSKVLAEELINKHKALGLNSIILRLFNTSGVGSNEDIKIGTNVITLIANALKKNSLFTIAGNDFPTKDGSVVKDFIHINDVTDAVIKATEKTLKEGAGGTYNLGRGKGTSLFEIIEKSEKVSGKKLQTSIIPKSKYEPPELIVDNSKIKTELEWETKYSIDDIVESLWNWFKSH